MRLDMPGRGLWLTAYRSATKVGVFLSLRGETAEELRTALSHELGDLREEGGLDLVLTGEDGTDNARGANGAKPSLSATTARGPLGGEAGELTWLTDAANRMVTLLRPRLSAWEVTGR